MGNQSIKISSFTGMNNVRDAEGLFVDRGVASPRVVLNADVSAEGRLIKRGGMTKIISLTDGHSEWAGATCHLVMDGTILKRVSGNTATAIQDFGGVKAPMYYAEVGDLVYFSSMRQNGIFDPATDTVSDWGIPTPEGPVLSAGAGNLPAGTYHVCFTTISGTEMSGNGPVSAITLSEEGGIVIGNRQASGIVWCTETDGHVFFKAGAVDTVVQIASVEPLPSLFCSPPPFLQYITHAFGVMWGAWGNKVYHSEALHPEWWRMGAARFEFATDVTMIAKGKTGMFFGCVDRTHAFMGTHPAKMEQRDVGEGAVPGTLVYCNNLIELGDTISPPEKKHESVPVWLSRDGFVAGNPAGRLFSLSQGKVRFAPGEEGASLYRLHNGAFQLLTSFKQGDDEDSIGMSDETTITVMRNGKVVT